jgi:hypothetical protein
VVSLATDCPFRGPESGLSPYQPPWGQIRVCPLYRCQAASPSGDGTTYSVTRNLASPFLVLFPVTTSRGVAA